MIQKKKEKRVVVGEFLTVNERVFMPFGA